VPAYVIRHAKAGDRGDWEGDDRLRPLTGSGRRQAEVLAARLKVEPIRAVVSSPYTRCVQTIQPLGVTLGLTVETSDGLAEGAGARGLRRVIGAYEGRNPALCTHGDVVEELLHYLVEHGIIARSRVANEKGGTWVLELRAGKISGATYVPAPA
jgi:broad specificity phosphatase PhoE